MNLRRLSQQIYSLPPLATREPLHAWSWRWDSNPQPADYKSAALPVELRQQGTPIKLFFLTHSLPAVNKKCRAFTTNYKALKLDRQPTNLDPTSPQTIVDQPGVVFDTQYRTYQTGASPESAKSPWWISLRRQAAMPSSRAIKINNACKSLPVF